jgi:hypothetical protein
MAPGNDLVSIAMPVLNAEKTILPALRSLSQQSYRNWECLVIDDGSVDRTTEIAGEVRDDRIRLFKDEHHKGLATRLNEAIALSQGHYLARMDGDDIAYPQRLQRQIEYLEAHPDVDLVGSHAIVFDNGGKVLGRRGIDVGRLWWYRLMLKSVPLIHPTFAGRTRWFKSHQYKHWAEHFQDQQLLLENLDDVRLAVIPEILLGYREGRLSISKQIRYRKSFIRAFPFLRQQSGLPIAALGVLVQGAKLARDIVAISTGLNYHLLRSRASPVSGEDLLRWRQVWRFASTP